MTVRAIDGHLSEPVLWDLVVGEAHGEAEDHLRGCAACRERLEEAREGLGLARAAALREPPADYRRAFRGELERRIDAVERGRRWLPAAALAAAAALVAAVSVLAPRAPIAPQPAATLPAWTPLPPREADSGFRVLEAIVAVGDDLGPAAGCRNIGDCLASLTDEESEALTSALQRRLQGEGL